MQNYSAQLKQLSRDHARLKFLIREQQTQLGEVLKRFEIIDEFDNIKKGKGKKPSKNLADICFQKTGYVQISDKRIKEQLKKILESDEECAEQLQKLNDKGVLFNTFWNDKLYSKVVSSSNFTHMSVIEKTCNFKNKYYEFHNNIFLKLWGEKDTKEQMREWKKNSKKAYKDLYNPSDLDNPNFATFFSLIIKAPLAPFAALLGSIDSIANTALANAIWTQAVLETIFDEEYLSPKIDADVINVSTSFLAISEAAIQENYEVSSGDGGENDYSSDSNYEE
ncbi:chad domain-containing protein: PROVISIONAL [Gigaspora margarita]|uniref:Chad domain-containing protein: PROVISIONAL n=1 Tax=Gigaspora margarita TaxID=4874 RepID=A0A8H3XL73_GIGMA|nr:chad domain-containing protein: PROVISIONAL [Gigaspora margarita]